MLTPVLFVATDSPDSGILQSAHTGGMGLAVTGGNTSLGLLHSSVGASSSAGAGNANASSPQEPTYVNL